MGLEELKSGILQYFTRIEMKFKILVPYADGKMQAYVHDKCQITSEEYREDGVYFTGRVSPELYHKLEAYTV